jgi:hypothetical protein
MMASPLIAGIDVRTMTPSTIAILTNLEAIAVNQDLLGIQGHVVRNTNGVSLWADKKLYDGSQAVVIYNQQNSTTQVRIDWFDLGLRCRKSADIIKYCGDRNHAIFADSLVIKSRLEFSVLRLPKICRSLRCLPICIA